MSAITSVLTQSHTDLELIVIDDGSTDMTERVLSGIDDRRVSYLRQNVNRGIAATRNIGLRAAQGEFISFIDSDDVWKPYKLEREVGLLRAHPEVEGVFGDLEKTDRVKVYPRFTRSIPVFSSYLRERSFTGYLVLNKRDAYLMSLQELFMKPSSFTVRRNVLGTIGMFNEHLSCGEDWEYLIRFTRVARLAFIDEPLAELHILEDAAHLRMFVEDKQDMLQVLRQERKRLSGDVEALRAVRAGVLCQRKHLGWHYLECEKKGAASAAFFKGFLETLDVGLGLRAVDALLPRAVGRALRRFSGVTRRS
jgi:glycosyltransferase involved in cell wall biosynthesis